MSNVLKHLLVPATVLYAAVILIRNRLFDLGLFRRCKAGIPVVSVGNITVGGTGKTPLVDCIVKYYSGRGLKPAILSRGYKRSTKGVQLVSDGSRILLGSREAGDESAMLAHKNPETVVVVAEKRKDGVNYINEHFSGRLPDVLVLDDGFQHRQLDRDLDIVVINTTAPFFEDRLIPAGFLREPRKNLGRADLLILSKVTDHAKADFFEEKLQETGNPLVKAGIRAGKPVCFAGPESPPPGRVIALAGIGQPESFIASLLENGMQVVSRAFFPDHADFPLKNMNALAEQALRDDLSIVTTEKDYFRLRANSPILEALSRVPCFYLPVETNIIKGQELFEKMLDDVVIP